MKFELIKWIIDSQNSLKFTSKLYQDNLYYLKSLFYIQNILKKHIINLLTSLQCHSTSRISKKTFIFNINFITNNKFKKYSRAWNFNENSQKKKKLFFSLFSWKWNENSIWFSFNWSISCGNTKNFFSFAAQRLFELKTFLREQRDVKVNEARVLCWIWMFWCDVCELLARNLALGG